MLFRILHVAGGIRNHLLALLPITVVFSSFVPNFSSRPFHSCLHFPLDYDPRSTNSYAFSMNMYPWICKFSRSLFTRLDPSIYNSSPTPNYFRNSFKIEFCSNILFPELLHRTLRVVNLIQMSSTCFCIIKCTGSRFTLYYTGLMIWWCWWRWIVCVLSIVFWSCSTRSQQLKILR